VRRRSSRVKLSADEYDAKFEELRKDDEEPSPRSLEIMRLVVIPFTKLKLNARWIKRWRIPSRAFVLTFKIQNTIPFQRQPRSFSLKLLVYYGWENCDYTSRTRYCQRTYPSNTPLNAENNVIVYQV